MARLTKREEREYITTFCGINPSTFEVETIYEERGGMLRRSGGGEHYPLKGRRAEHEIAVVWHLIEITSYPTWASNEEWVKTKRWELGERAAELKAAAEARGKG
jgi:hypothetical protein